VISYHFHILLKKCWKALYFVLF